MRNSSQHAMQRWTTAGRGTAGNDPTPSLQDARGGATPHAVDGFPDDARHHAARRVTRENARH
jgi:hypothetical protein